MEVAKKYVGCDCCDSETIKFYEWVC
ncbi:MAG: hypothetical protein MJK14_09475 [Rivularia sp. ALOHA_DT_140]|nr:hypothetical protein [Rivularia sp. ALOHA_DT_140]